jgi:hypothetical protein
MEVGEEATLSGTLSQARFSGEEDQSLHTPGTQGRTLNSYFWGGRMDRGLNPGLCACEVGTLLLEPHLQFVLLWLI